MTASEIARLQKYLSEKFGLKDVSVRARPKKDDSVEVFLGDEFIALIYRDEDEGEVSYAFQMSILDIDLPLVAGLS